MSEEHIDDITRSVLGPPAEEYVRDVMVEGIVSTREEAERTWYQATLQVERDMLRRGRLLTTEWPTPRRAVEAILDFVGERFAIGTRPPDLVLTLSISDSETVIFGKEPPEGTWEQWVSHYGRICRDSHGLMELVTSVVEDDAVVVAHVQDGAVTRYRGTRDAEFGVRWDVRPGDEMDACPTIVW